jgi:hypothetical protein
MYFMVETPSFRALNCTVHRVPEPFTPIASSRAQNMLTWPILLSILGVGNMVLCPENILSWGSETFMQFNIFPSNFIVVCQQFRFVTSNKVRFMVKLAA